MSEYLLALLVGAAVGGGGAWGLAQDHYAGKLAAQALAHQQGQNSALQQALDQRNYATARLATLQAQGATSAFDADTKYRAAVRRLRNSAPAGLRCPGVAGAAPTVDGASDTELPQSIGEATLQIGRAADETARRYGLLQEYLRVVAPACGISLQ